MLLAKLALFAYVVPLLCARDPSISMVLLTKIKVKAAESVSRTGIRAPQATGSVLESAGVCDSIGQLFMTVSADQFSIGIT